MIGTLAVDGWAVTFGTARGGLGGEAQQPRPLLDEQMYVDRLGSGPRLVGRIGSGVRVNANLKKNSCRVLSYGAKR